MRPHLLLPLLLAFAAPGAAALPPDLAATGLGTAQALAFTPQYPLWSDGTRKRRWLALPPGAAIDASRAEAWDFPPGTRVWKEFSYGARRLETRYLERLADGSWSFATYVWNAEGTKAVLAPAEGIAALPVAEAPNGRYAIPSRADCLACHDAAPAPVLGFSALQLAPELRALAARGTLRNLPASLAASPPAIPAPTPDARAALGYLHGNCGHCHNDAGPLASVELSFLQHPARPGESAARTVRSILDGGAGRLARRMQSKNPHLRMPPLGVSVVDAHGAALIERWTDSLSTHSKEE
jgi:hypothetical protein